MLQLLGFRTVTCSPSFCVLSFALKIICKVLKTTISIPLGWSLKLTIMKVLFHI